MSGRVDQLHTQITAIASLSPESSDLIQMPVWPIGTLWAGLSINGIATCFLFAIWLGHFRWKGRAKEERTDSAPAEFAP